MSICGVVVIDLDNDPCWEAGEFIGAPAPIPAGVRVRVLIGNARYVSLDDCQAIAQRVWAAASVEVIGSDPQGIRSLVDYLRQREQEQRGAA